VPEDNRNRLLRESLFKCSSTCSPSPLGSFRCSSTVWGMIETSIIESAGAERMVRSRFAEQGILTAETEVHFGSRNQIPPEVLKHLFWIEIRPALVNRVIGR